MTLMDVSKNKKYPVIVPQLRILIRKNAGLVRSYAPLAKGKVVFPHPRTEVYEMNKVSKD